MRKDNSLNVEKMKARIRRLQRENDRLSKETKLSQRKMYDAQDRLRQKHDSLKEAEKSLEKELEANARLRVQINQLRKAQSQMKTTKASLFYPLHQNKL